MTNEEIMAYQAERKKFAESEIGRLYHKHRRAMITAYTWEGSSRKRADEISNADQEAEDAFIGRLMADYGII